MGIRQAAERDSELCAADSDGGCRVNTEIFCTENVAQRYNPVHGWQDVNRRLVALDFRTTPRDKHFHASIRVCSSRRLRFSTLNVSAHVTTLDAVHYRDTEPYYLVAYLKEGSVTVAQDGREAFVTGDNLVIVDTSRPFRIETPTTMHANSVDIPSARIREIFPQVEGLTSVSITGGSGPGAVLRCMLENIFNRAADINDDGADFIADAIPYLTAGALASLPAAKGILPDKIESFQRHRVRSFVRANLRDRELDPEAIARSLNLSLRYVHKLFEDEPTTLMQWIWAERIARCGDDLAKPELRSRTVSEIAYSWGFSDPAHFSRLFRAHLGQPPSAFRDQHALR